MNTNDTSDFFMNTPEVWPIDHCDTATRATTDNFCRTIARAMSADFSLMLPPASTSAPWDPSPPSYYYSSVMMPWYPHVQQTPGTAEILPEEFHDSPVVRNPLEHHGNFPSSTIPQPQFHE